ncbi:twitching motility protein PilT [Spirillospora sp. CA-294931]|uniref:twitching motility protein PilT n=1 Tax=Spirillospora sp. CA-294931 TaxID=3240042 RepID=UPI003D8AA2DB
MIVNPYIYDTGVLMAAERGDERVWRLHMLAYRDEVRVIVPAPVVAQAWRDPKQVRMARLLKAVEVRAMDDDLARRAGRLCGESNTADVVDATVAVLAADLNATVLTSDPGDINRLVDQQNALARVEVMAV